MLPGRDMTERWYMATSPYLEAISGEEPVIAELIDQAKGENGTRLDTLVSLAVLTTARQTSAEGMLSLYGDTFHLEREVIEDGHAFAAVIDACGKSGHGDLGAALCLRSSHDLDKAWEITRQHRVKVIGAIKAAHPVAGAPSIYEVQDVTLASDVADVLARDRVHTIPVLVYAQDGDMCRLSARSPAGTDVDLGSFVRNLATTCGGNGGGHHHGPGQAYPVTDSTRSPTGGRRHLPYDANHRHDCHPPRECRQCCRGTCPGQPAQHDHNRRW